MKKINWEDIAFKLILHSGNARSQAFLALQSARKGDFKKVDLYLKKSSKELKKAHEVQTKVLQTGGAKLKPDLLMVHAHAHLMTAMSEKSLIEEMIEMCKKFKNSAIGGSAFGGQNSKIKNRRTKVKKRKRGRS